MFDDLYKRDAWDGHTRTQGDLVDMTPEGEAEQVDLLAVWEPGIEEDQFLPETEQDMRNGRLSFDPAVLSAGFVTQAFTVRIPAASIGGGARDVYAVKQIVQTEPVTILRLVEQRRTAFGGRSTRQDRG